MVTITSIEGLEILDSRGRPTVEARVRLSSGVTATAQTPSGASTGRHEAVELRDGDPGRYSGLGVRRAVENVNREIAPALAGRDPLDQAGVDQALRTLDGSAGKSRLGANAILAVSCAVARAAAQSAGAELWQWLHGLRAASVPVPMVNIFSGGKHAAGNIDFQDFLAIPHGFDTYSESLHAAVAIHGAARRELRAAGLAVTGVADEGGWGPRFASNEQALELLTRAIEAAGYKPATQVSIGLDVAASHFHTDGGYRLAAEGRVMSSEEMISRLADWSARYPVLSIEDGLEEDDWQGWRRLNERLGARLQLVGDDLFTTNPVRVRRGISERAANAVLVKMNQIGTLTETFEVIDMARAAGFRAVVSARSGETEDSFLADLAVASGAGQIKVGSITRSERLAKYNRLLAIEKSGQLEFPGRRVFSGLAAISG